MPLPFSPFNAKSVLAFLLTLVGIGLLATGILALFTEGAYGDGLTWAMTILGFVLFGAGIGLLKST